MLDLPQPLHCKKHPAYSQPLSTSTLVALLHGTSYLATRSGNTEASLHIVQQFRHTLEDVDGTGRTLGGSSTIHILKVQIYSNQYDLQLILPCNKQAMTSNTASSQVTCKANLVELLSHFLLCLH